MMRRVLAWLIGLPVAILLILLAVANRQAVTLSLDPFSADVPAYSVTLPLFGVIFLALLVGIVIGGTATWFGQGRWRRAARLRRYEINEMRAAAPPPSPSGQLALPPRG
jgi:uncharacterized integral membrane protein